MGYKKFHYVNDRFDYANKNNNPVLYDKKNDIFYPGTDTPNGMMFKDFIFGNIILMGRDEKGFLNFNDLTFYTYSLIEDLNKVKGD